MKVKVLGLLLLSSSLLTANPNGDLIEAAYRGDASGVTKALQEGAYVNARNHYGASALMLAALNGNTDIVQALLEAGTDKTIKDCEGETAYDLAAYDLAAKDQIRSLLK